MICYGLAPYFSQLLVKELNSSLFIATSFDECFNQINQKGQMDLFVRYWNNTSNQVSTRYLSSSFMGKALAINVLEHFDQSCWKIQKQSIIQISSDGLNMNLKFLDLGSASNLENFRSVTITASRLQESDKCHNLSSSVLFTCMGRKRKCYSKGRID